MKEIVKMFLEKEMLLSPKIYNEIKGKNNDELNELLSTVNYSLVLENIEKKEVVKEEENKTEVPEENKSSSNTVFDNFVKDKDDNKKETSREVKNESSDLNQEKEENKEVSEEDTTSREIEREVKEETPITYEHKIEILTNMKRVEGNYNVDDFIKSSNERYEFIKNLLIDKMDTDRLTSINKIKDFSDVSVIGIVKSVDKKNGTTLDLEDSTGLLRVKIEDDKSNFLIGDVIGLDGIMKNEVFMPKKIIFPDVSMKRNISTSENDVSIMFCGKVNTDNIDNILEKANENNTKYLLFTGKEDVLNEIKKKDLGDMKLIFSPSYIFSDGMEPYISNIEGSDSVLTVSSPSLVSIEGVNVLIYNGSSYETLPRNVKGVLEILKRRYIPLKLTIQNFLIDKVPDIVYSSLDEAGFRNYKGNTLISSDDNNIVIVNLKTRESKVIPVIE